MSSVQGPPETPAATAAPVSGTTDTRPLCPECLSRFPRRHPGQLFCTVAHRDAWNGRAAVRGRVLTPLAIVARVTRNGTRGDRATGARAASEAATLIQQCCDEDRAAGRMSHPEYLARRYRVGFDPL